MGPEELAIITNPQFINATFQAGENWYHGMVARAQEANRLAQRRNSFEAANAQYAIVNQQILEGARQQNEKWKAFANDLVKKHDEYAVLARRLLDEEIADRQSETKAKRVFEQQLATEKAHSAEKDTGIARLQNDLAGVRGALAATQESLTYERQNSAAIATESGKVKAALQASEGARQSALTELKEAGEKVTSLEAQRRDAMSVTLAVEAAGMAVMYVTAQAMESWAAQGKAPMLDNLMTSHFKDGGQPMTMREYLWFATLIKEMRKRDIPDYLIHCRCKVDGIEDFLERNPHISEEKVDTKAV
ncbi:hypothetical protein [Acetobacter senegalensis]|uniref:hypothetical protein n=1 Tax=Acetobacter senegalensis TaxID=446692 RepID=UPI00264F262C|nr:hypothetical protein [Acetobacter senegalensis]MDN7349997.1 hypothetical protein [Acetobacter senegalensis]